MASPVKDDNERPERMAKFMNGAAGMMVRLFGWEYEDHRVITVYDLGVNSKATRRSTRGSAIMRGRTSCKAGAPR